MTDNRNPIHSESGTVFVGGSRRGEGALLLYPDKLAVVTISSITALAYVAVPLVYLAVYFFRYHALGSGLVAVWYLAGWWVLQAVNRRRAVRKMAAGRDGVTVIPLDQVTSVRCTRPAKAAGWLGLRSVTVMTADGTEYGFRGLTDKWHAQLASALTAYGREVHVAPESITVLPWATLEEG